MKKHIRKQSDPLSQAAALGGTRPVELPRLPRVERSMFTGKIPRKKRVYTSRVEALPFWSSTGIPGKLSAKEELDAGLSPGEPVKWNVYFYEAKALGLTGMRRDVKRFLEKYVRKFGRNFTVGTTEGPGYITFTVVNRADDISQSHAVEVH